MFKILPLIFGVDCYMQSLWALSRHFQDGSPHTGMSLQTCNDQLLTCDSKHVVPTKKQQKNSTWASCWSIRELDTWFFAQGPYQKQLCNLCCLIEPIFLHTLHAFQHVSMFSVSTSKSELRPQLHDLLHFPWQHYLTQGQLCFPAWVLIVTGHA